jgi:hypothetical protein
VRKVLTEEEKLQKGRERNKKIQEEEEKEHDSPEG